MKKAILTAAISLVAVAAFAQSGTTRARSAKTGQYVSKDYARKNPSTTVVEKQRTSSSSSSGRSSSSRSSTGTARKPR